MTKIVWNGCDSYIEADDAARFGYNFDGRHLFKGCESFEAFEATEIDPTDLPKDELGEPDFNGIFGAMSGKYYKL